MGLSKGNKIIKRLVFYILPALATPANPIYFLISTCFLAFLPHFCRWVGLIVLNFLYNSWQGFLLFGKLIFLFGSNGGQWRGRPGKGRKRVILLGVDIKTGG